MKVVCKMVKKEREGSPINRPEICTSEREDRLVKKVRQWNWREGQGAWKAKEGPMTQ